MARPRGDTTELASAGEWEMGLDGGVVVVTRRAYVGPHPYAPAGVGDTWVYETSQSSGPACEAIEEIVAARDEGARWIARVRSTTAGVTFERDLVIGPEGLSPELGVMIGPSGTVTTRASAGVYLPRAAPAGHAWSWRQTLEMPVGVVEVESACESCGLVEITVPAGTFVATHVRGVTRSAMTIAGQPIAHEQTEDNYFARGVGLVRAVVVTSTGHRTEKSLVRARVGG